jgi:hypothetical protein
VVFAWEWKIRLRGGVGARGQFSILRGRRQENLVGKRRGGSADASEEEGCLFEIRGPKSEDRRKAEIRNPNKQRTVALDAGAHLESSFRAFYYET